jgi:hypothetical protein
VLENCTTSERVGNRKIATGMLLFKSVSEACVPRSRIGLPFRWERLAPIHAKSWNAEGVYQLRRNNKKPRQQTHWRGFKFDDDEDGY